jgi:hypothetical protein
MRKLLERGILRNGGLRVVRRVGAGRECLLLLSRRDSVCE